METTINCRFLKKPLRDFVDRWGYLVSLPFVYAGAVNLGSFDLFPALPFLSFIAKKTYQGPKTYLLPTLLLFVVCIPLYIFKSDNYSTVFYPSVGKSVQLSRDLCYEKKEAGEYKADVLHDFRLEECKGSILKRGTKLRISKIRVSNADMGESYQPYLAFEERELWLASSMRKPITWPDGKTLTIHDLRRDIFYIPSLLMIWPMVPLIIALKINEHLQLPP